MSKYESWGFEEGDEIRPGRVVLKTIGGGNRYEICLVWDESLFDLSVARTLERAAATAGPIGTDPYMSPEQCGEPSTEPIGPAADAWGLGATLFHAIAGEKPFPPGSGNAGAERFPQLIEEPRPLPNHVPEALRTLIAELPRKMRLSRRGAAGI